MPFDVKDISRILAHMLLCLENPLREKICGIDFYILNDTQMSWANKRYMLSSGPTNILSFPGDNNNLPGTLLFSADTFSRECLFYGQVPMEYFIYLVAHGIGHLAGYVHGREMYEVCDALYTSGIKIRDALCK